MSAELKPLIILAAGGTGGHLFPAQALGEALIKRGYRIHLMTDERVQDYGKSFPSEATHIVESASPSPRRPNSLLKLFRGYRAAKAIMKREKPAAVIGFGGYPSFPPIYAAASLGIPTLVHEANSVLGRANKLLARKRMPLLVRLHEQPPSFALRLKVRLHHLICVWCQRYERQLKFLHDAAPRLRQELEHASTRRLSDESKHRMTERLREECRH